MYFPDWSVNYDLTEFYNLLQSIYSAIPKPIFQILSVMGLFAMFISFRNKIAGGDE